MIPINIDASAFAEAFAIPEADLKQFTSNVISELATEFALLWSLEADVLKSSRKEYKNSIYTEKIDDFNYVVGLNGFIPNAVESGISGFDMKADFKKSSKATHLDGGDWYLTIPFRHAITGSIGEDSAFSGVMPSEVYKEAKSLPEGKGLDIKNVPKEFQIPKIRPEVVTKSQVFKEYQNKFSIFAGIQKKKDQSGRGTYTSFRRVSSNSDPDSWIHTGIKSRGLAEKALSRMDIPSIVDALAAKYIDQL